MPLLTTQSAKGYGFGKFAQAGYATGNFVSLQTLTGTGSSGTLTFTDIPQTFRHLQIHALTKGTATGSVQGTYRIQINGDTGNNYASTQLVGNGAGTSQVFQVAAVSQNAIFAPNSMYWNTFCSSGTTNSMGAAIININEYTNSSWYKTVRTIDGHERGNNDDTSRVDIGGGVYTSSSPITSITFQIYDEAGSLTNFTTTTKIALYGIVG